MGEHHDDRVAEPAPDTPRAPLSRRSILELAIDLVDREGLSKLTMRRLGAECGVEAMALYRYVHSREDLLSGIVDHLVDELRTDQLAARRQEDGWQDFLVRLAHGVRQIALDHPELFPLVATRAPEAPWVRPPLRSLRWMETFLDTLLSYGFDDAAAVAAYRSYTTFLLGQLLLEVSARQPGPPLGDSTRTDEQDLSDYPHLRRLQPMLAQDHSVSEFEDALEALLDRLEGFLTQ
ncbi:TetR/AcrR family transcriptional regulator [Nocardia blacklockiae]|uniref:TetR/AcrR family transcriptional regulator n=1 Tax=Nocardia blacklockiae TaxID=480036 RepID=UPI001895139A|nr:TetR/AcrR family transcriptional regulator [Nocardia blacklockiae]MBF6171865.1 TetR/AcrR family transcriptional regulator C-terminal domain-containing protein [Nocardia blacklockiae]